MQDVQLLRPARLHRPDALRTRSRADRGAPLDQKEPDGEDKGLTANRALECTTAVGSCPAIQSPRISKRSSCRGFRPCPNFPGTYCLRFSIGPTKRAYAGSASLGMALTRPALGKPRMLKAAREPESLN